MKFLFSFIIFLNIFTNFFSLENKNISNYNYDSHEIKIYTNANNIASIIDDCFIYIQPLIVDDIKKANFSELIKCVINCSIYDISNLEEALSLLKQILNNDYLIKKIEDADIKLMLKILVNATKSGIFDEFVEIIKKNTSILNDLLIILDETGKGKDMKVENIYEPLNRIFNIDGISRIFRSI